MLKKNKGFTLIELLVVVAIIGVLSSVVLSSLNSARGKGNDARRLSDIKQISNALELYYNDNGIYPNVGWPDNTSINTSWNNGTSPLALALLPYLRKLPIDPKNNDVSCYGNGAHFYTYVSFNSGRDYGIYASLENPKTASQDPKNFPCCATPNPGNCMYKATNGGVGIVSF